MNEIIKLIEKPGAVDFNQIKISIARSMMKLHHGLMEKLRNQKQ